MNFRYTGCPTNMLTTSDSVFYSLKPDMSKSKTCFEILVKKAFRWHLETYENKIGSIFRINIKTKCQIPKENCVRITNLFCQNASLCLALCQICACY